MRTLLPASMGSLTSRGEDEYFPVLRFDVYVDTGELVATVRKAVSTFPA